MAKEGALSPIAPHAGSAGGEVELAAIVDDAVAGDARERGQCIDRKSTRLNSSHNA